MFYFLKGLAHGHIMYFSIWHSELPSVAFREIEIKGKENMENVDP